MALTLASEQRLTKVGLVALFEAHRSEWRAAAQNSHTFVQANFPAGSQVRPDDVAKALVPVVEVNERLKAALAEKKLTQKYWVSYFTDLVIDRVWHDIA